MWILGRDNEAHVIDIDGNGNTGDAGAMWVPGEIFSDGENGISVSIDSASDTGFVVTINNRFATMGDIEIEGPGLGQVFESIPFTATVSPEDATTPITYTWEATDQPPMQHVGDSQDSIEFTWDEIGTKAITVTASNAGSSVMDTRLIEISSLIPIVSLSGPTESTVGTENVFIATSVPTNVIQPIIYTWQASGQIPITNTTGLSDTVSYTWGIPGTQVITVTAENVVGSTTDTFSLPISMPPENLDITGPYVGGVDESYSFAATIFPITTTVPITYFWTVDGELTVTNSAGIFDTVNFSWDQPGLHQISASADNRAGTVDDTWSISIFIRLFLPYSIRN